MRNMTITVSEDVARWARVWAAKHDTSVSRMVGEMLSERKEADEGYEAARAAFLGKEPRKLREGGSYPSREQIHDR